jgi:hypothetical protein
MTLNSVEIEINLAFDPDGKAWIAADDVARYLHAIADQAFAYSPLRPEQQRLLAATFRDAAERLTPPREEN